MQNSKWFFEAVRVNAKNDYSRVCTATRSDCSFLCIFIRQVARLVKQSNSSQGSCRPNASLLTGSFDSGTFHHYFFQWPDAPGEGPTSSVGNRVPTIEKSFRNHLFPRFDFLPRHESKGRDLVLRALSGFISQLKTDLLVHALQLPLHFWRHGVSSSPMGTMFASAPSKFTQSTSRTSHPSMLSPEVVLHVEHYQLRLCCGVACIIMLPCPCGQKGRSISTSRFPVDASTVRLFSFVSGSRATMVRGMRCHRFPHISHRSEYIAALPPPSGSQSVDGRSRSAPSSTLFPGCLSVRLCRAPTGPPENSQHCSSCPSSLVAPVVVIQAGCPLIVPW